MYNLKPPTPDEFRTVLRRHGLKATRQRMAVHDAMMALGHASADRVTAELAARGEVKVTVASVYNILSQMADLKIYGRRMSANNKMYFDVNAIRHLHLYDRENHRYRDVAEDEMLDEILSRLRRRKFKGYTIEDIDIQFVCRPTRKGRAAL